MGEVQAPTYAFYLQKLFIRFLLEEMELTRDRVFKFFGKRAVESVPENVVHSVDALNEFCVEGIRFLFHDGGRVCKFAREGNVKNEAPLSQYVLPTLHWEKIVRRIPQGLHNVNRRVLCHHRLDLFHEFQVLLIHNRFEAEHRAS